MMQHRKILLVSLIVLFSFFPKAKSSDYFFNIIDGKNGLSQNNVKSIIQDSYGFMWFGTRNRLNRFDGLSIKVFDCYDTTTGKGNNNISALYEAPDRRLWLGTDQGVYIFDPVKETFTQFRTKTKTGDSIVHWISDIQMDQDENIWIVVPNQGVFRYNLNTENLHKYTVVENLQPSISNPQCIAIEKNGRIWIGTNGSGVYLYNKNEDAFSQFLGSGADSEHSLAGKNIYTMCHYNDYLMIGIHEGKLLKYDKRRDQLTDALFPDANYKIIRHVTLINDDELWIGTQSGLYIFDNHNRIMEHTYEDPLNANSLSDNIVEKIYKDKEGGVWIGTNFGGVNYLPNRNSKFEKYIPLSKNHSIVSKRVREMKEASDGRIWIGTEDAGVTVFDPIKKEFNTVNNLFYNKTLALLPINSKIWVGYFKNGLDIINPDNFQSLHYTDKELGLNEESVYALCEDRFGKVWLGNAWGVYVAEKGQMHFSRKDIFGLNFIYDIMEDSEGYIWVATMGSGVYKYNQQKDELIHYLSNGANSLSSNSVSSITEDYFGQIWFATDRGGVCVYNKNSNAFTSYSVNEGLPDNVAYKILEDKRNNLWFGTNQGLVKFNPKTKAVRVFTKNDGLLCDQFNYKSGLSSSNGKFYFGSLEGLIAFDPEEFRENSYIPPVYITKLTIFNIEVEPGDKNSPLEKSIVHTNKIILSANQSNIGFEFVALSYTAPYANMYAYKMENIDNDWVHTKNNHSASYAKLPPGKYLFKVKGANNDGLWNEHETVLEVVILPPWWASKLAYFIYFLVLATIMFFAIRVSLRKYKLRNNEKQRLFKIEKEKELYEAKVSFFTDIAHEIRTPVTLINGPLESILEMNLPDEKLKNNLNIIEENTKHLLSLINQLLDFRKVDSKKFILNQKEINITALARKFIAAFEQQMTSQKKTLQTELKDEDIFAVADAEALSKILTNLISNAVKYSEQFIEIILDSDDCYFTFRISNDGEIISTEHANKIFEPFYQVKSSAGDTSGSGIGLSLARSLAELHNGYLFYDTQSGLNSFILKIPLNKVNDDSKNPDIEAIDILSEYIDKTPAESNKTNPETILVVEDNISMLNFIVDKLQEFYHVEKAVDGLEAQKILEIKNVDVVVSDIMMPEMDGFELCSFIKSNIEYSHILVILLTARNDLPSKIQGLELGADAYVEKPFSFQYLQTLLTSLINNRKREKELFLKKPFMSIQQVGLSKADEQFMNKIIDVINENITEPSFGVEALSEAVFMSRSSLHRKLKSTINIPPTEFIRFVRLQKAAQLIKDGEFRINEICYLVGINSPSYFIKIFQKQFGMTPKEFAKQE